MTKLDWSSFFSNKQKEDSKVFTGIKHCGERYFF